MIIIIIIILLFFLISVTNNRGHLILQSSRFDRVSETDLDTVLEAIEEEGSREGSLSPICISSNNEGDKTGFKWEPVYNKNGDRNGSVKRDEELMDQLMNIHKQQERKESGKDTKMTTNNGSDHPQPQKKTEKNEDLLSECVQYLTTYTNTTCYCAVCIFVHIQCTSIY